LYKWDVGTKQFLTVLEEAQVIVELNMGQGGLKIEPLPALGAVSS